MVDIEEILALQRRVRDLERRMRALDGERGLEPVDAAEDPAIVALLSRGDTIGAIRRYREITGLGLAEAKAVIEQL